MRGAPQGIAQKVAIKWTDRSDIVTNCYGESWELKFSRIFTLVKINKVHRKQQGQEAKIHKKSFGMIITTWDCTKFWVRIMGLKNPVGNTQKPKERVHIENKANNNCK